MKRLSEVVLWRMADNSMTKIKTRHTMVDNTLHGKPKIEQHEPHYSCNTTCYCWFLTVFVFLMQWMNSLSSSLEIHLFRKRKASIRIFTYRKKFQLRLLQYGRHYLQDRNRQGEWNEMKCAFILLFSDFHDLVIY